VSVINEITESEKLEIIFNMWNYNEKAMSLIDPGAYQFDNGASYLKKKTVKLIKEIGGVFETYKYIQNGGRL
jgi:hypothetical protein